MEFNLGRDFKISELKRKMEPSDQALLDELLGTRDEKGSVKIAFQQMILMDILILFLNGYVKFTTMEGVDIGMNLARSFHWILGPSDPPHECSVSLKAAQNNFDRNIDNLMKIYAAMETLGEVNDKELTLSAIERSAIITNAEYKARLKMKAAIADALDKHGKTVKGELAMALFHAINGTE